MLQIDPGCDHRGLRPHPAARPIHRGDVWPTISRTVAALGQRLAAWFGVEAHRVAITESVSSGCVLPLWGLTWQAGDERLIGDAEHYGVVAACRELARRHGLTIATLPVTEMLDGSSAAARLASHPSRPWLLVDAAQSLGNIPVAEAAHAADIDACTGHKWCCGHEGLGAVVLSDRLLAETSPTVIGWRSLASESQSANGFHSDARRFEVATSCTPLLAGISTLLLEPPAAGLVSFTAHRANGDVIDPSWIVGRLGEQEIWLRTLDDPAWVRACTHLTTTDTDMDLLLEALVEITSQS